jgi:hypothetical protein
LNYLFLVLGLVLHLLLFLWLRHIIANLLLVLVKLMCLAVVDTFLFLQMHVTAKVPRRSLFWIL